MGDTFEEVKAVVIEVLDIGDDVEITPDTRFVEDLKADSMDQFFLFDDFCERFNLTIKDEDYTKIKTVGDAVRYIEELKK